MRHFFLIDLERRGSMTCFLLDAQEMQERIAAKAQTDCFEGNHLVGRDVAEVYVGPKEFNEPDLLCLLRRFPNDFFEGNFCEDLLDET